MKAGSFQSCYSLTFSEYRDASLFTNFANLRELSIAYASWNLSIESQLKDLSHLFTVCISNNYYFDLLDLSPLYSVPVVALKGLRLQTLTGLGGNRKVELCSCSGIIDFSPLRSIFWVCLSWISSLKNGVGLENVSYLTIRNCNNFSDVSALKNVKHLSIDGCCALQEVGGLEDVHTVSILYCNSLLALTGLGNNEKIVIQREDIGLLQKCPAF
jgi:hypothetical protein